MTNEIMIAGFGGQGVALIADHVPGAGVQNDGQSAGVSAIGDLIHDGVGHKAEEAGVVAHDIDRFFREVFP